MKPWLRVAGALALAALVDHLVARVESQAQTRQDQSLQRLADHLEAEEDRKDLAAFHLRFHKPVQGTYGTFDYLDVLDRTGAEHHLDVEP